MDYAIYCPAGIRHFNVNSINTNTLEIIYSHEISQNDFNKLLVLKYSPYLLLFLHEGKHLVIDFSAPDLQEAAFRGLFC